MAQASANEKARVKTKKLKNRRKDERTNKNKELEQLKEEMSEEEYEDYIKNKDTLLNRNRTASAIWDYESGAMPKFKLPFFFSLLKTRLSEIETEHKELQDNWIKEGGSGTCPGIDNREKTKIEEILNKEG